MTVLLYKALCLRILAAQWRPLVAAALSVSLGLALALAIRLGTESAALGFERSLATLARPDWVGPVRVRTLEASRALEPFFALFPYRTARTVPVTLGGSPLTLSLVWGGPLGDDPSAPATPTRSQAGAGTASATGDVAEPFLDIWVPDPCLPRFQEGVPSDAGAHPVQPAGTTSRVSLFGVSAMARIHGLSAARAFPGSGAGLADGSAQSCAVGFGAGPDFAGHPALKDVVQAPAGAFAGLAADEVHFHVVDALARKDFEDALSRLATQTPGLGYDSQRAQVDSLGKLTRSFNTNLQLMGFISLFIGVFMVQHVFSLVVAKNAKLIAILHAQGIRIPRMLGPLAGLVLGVGLVASALGIALGVSLGSLLARVTQGTVQMLYERRLDTSAFQWDAVNAGWALAMGLGACCVGAARPLWKVMRMDTAEVLRSGLWHVPERRSARVATWLALGVSLLLAGVCIQFPLVIQRLPVGAFAACLLILLATALLARELTRVAYLTALKSGWSVKARLPLQERLHLPPQNAIVVQVLALCFALTLSVKSMAESFRATLETWTLDTLKADLWVRARDSVPAPFPPEVVALIDDLVTKGVARAVDGLRVLPARLVLADGDLPIAFNGVRTEAQARVEPLKLLSPRTSQAELARAIHTRARTCEGTAASPCLAYISEALAIHARLPMRAGERIVVDVSARRLCFEVAGIVQDFGNDQGVVMTEMALVGRLLGETPLPSFMNVYLQERDARSMAAAKASLENALSKKPALDLTVMTLAELRGRVMSTFEQTFRITDALYVLCAGVAFVTVASSLNLQMLLRRREWNTLWALGFSARRLRSDMALWAGLTALWAYLVSLPGAFAIAAILVYVINYYSFGFSLALHVPISFLCGMAAVAFATGWASGALLARGLDKHLSASSLNLE